MAEKPELLVISPLLPDQMAQLEATYTLHRHDEAPNAEALLAEVADRITGVVTTGGTGFTAGMLDALPNLQIVSTSSVGTDSIDLAACAARGVVVTNTPDVLTDDVADLAMGLVIAAERRMVEGDKWVRSGDWAAKGAFPLTTAMRYRRMGILGLGRIGTAIAKRAEPFGLEIGYSARSAKDVEWAYFETPLALAEWSDILVVVVPGGSETQNLVDQSVLEALGPEGTFVNVARGSVVDEEALIAALSDGRLGYAGLDVFDAEPDTDPRFAAMDNVVLSPHHASGTVSTRDAMAQLVVDNLSSWFTRGKPLTPV